MFLKVARSENRWGVFWSVLSHSPLPVLDVDVECPGQKPDSHACFLLSANLVDQVRTVGMPA